MNHYDLIIITAVAILPYVIAAIAWHFTDNHHAKPKSKANPFSE